MVLINHFKGAKPDFFFKFPWLLGEKQFCSSVYSKNRHLLPKILVKNPFD